MHCTECGVSLSGSEKFCPSCGSSVVSSEQPALQQNSTSEFSRKPWYKRWWGISLIVLAAILFLSLLVGGGGDGENDADRTRLRTSPGVTETEPPSRVLDPGSIVEFADWSYKVSEVQVYRTIGDEVARGKFVVLLVEITNGANVPRKFGDLQLHLVDGEGRTFAMSGSTSLNHHHTYRVDTWHLEEIGPSLSGTIPIAFDVPADLTGGAAFGTATRRGSSSLSPFVIVQIPS